MVSRDRFGLHDEMGIGKTATTIGAINEIFADRGVVICPAMLRENWIKEFRKFDKYDLTLCKGVTVHDFVAWSRGRYNVLVTSYELATKWLPLFLKHGEYVDFIAFDEGHYLKNLDAGRTKALLGEGAAGGVDSLVQFAAYAWHITGTVMPNDPQDIYPFLRMCNAFDMDYKTFVHYFFDKTLTKFGARHSVKEHMAGVLRQLIDNNSIKRTHSDVGMELPQIWLKEILIEGNTVDLEEALAGYPHLEEAIVAAIEGNDMDMLDAAHIAVVRRLVGKAKAVPYAQMVKDEFDGGATKRVIFCCHTEPLLYVHNYLTKHGYKGVLAYGDTKERDRQQAVHDFMNDPSVDYFAANMFVAGVGLTLTSSSEVDLLESSWSPAPNAQAIKRVHRYGQQKQVHARFITLARSLDVKVNGLVAWKTANIAEIEGHRMTAAPPLDGLHGPV